MDLYTFLALGSSAIVFWLERLLVTESTKRFALPLTVDELETFEGFFSTLRACAPLSLTPFGTGTMSSWSTLACAFGFVFFSLGIESSSSLSIVSFGSAAFLFFCRLGRIICK